MQSSRMPFDHKHVNQIFLRYVSLNILSMLGISLYILADTFFIANGVGNDGLVALNIILPAYSIMSGTGLMLGIGGSTRFSIAQGEGDLVRANQIFTNTIILGVIFGAIFTIIGIFFCDQLAILLGAKQLIIPLSSKYLQTMFCFAIAFVLNNIFSCFIRNDHAPHLVTTALLAGSISNIILDYILIYPFKLGMFGAALATGCSPIVTLLILSIHYWNRKNTFHFIKSKLLNVETRHFFAAGIPTLLTELSSGVIILLFNFVILSLTGNIGIAAYGIISNIALVCIAIFTGVSQGIQPLISRSFGAQDHVLIRKFLYRAIFVVILLGILFFGCALCFPDFMISVFNKDQNPVLAEIAKPGLWIYFFSFIVAGINIIISAFFACIAQPRAALLLTVLRGFLLLVPILFVFSKLFGMIGVWLTVPITELCTLLISAALLFHYIKLK